MNMDLDVLNLPRSAMIACQSKYDSREFQPAATTYNNNYQAPARNESGGTNSQRSVRLTQGTKSQLMSAISGAAKTASAFYPTTVKKPIDYTEELTDFIYVLTPVGQILYASNAAKELLDYSKDDIIGHNVMEFIHPADVEDYVQAFNDSITHRVDFHNYHRFRKQDGSGLILETTGHAIFDDVELATDPQGHAVPICKCFVLTARPYPSQAVSALDSFLELKLEFELLKKELRDLGETEVDLDEITIPDEVMKRFSTSKHMISMGSAADTTKGTTGNFNRPKLQTRDSATAFKKENGSTKTESKDNNRNASTLQDRDSNSDEVADHTTTLDEAIIDFAKRKKSKKPRAGQIEHKCTDCGRTESPEWRKGIHGPKTLCNACGLRYSKRQKKVAALSLALGTPNDNAAYATSRGGRSQSSDSGHDNALTTPTSAFSTLHHRSHFATTAGDASGGFYAPALFMNADELSDNGSHLTSPMMHDPSYPPPNALGGHMDPAANATTASMNGPVFSGWR